MSTETPQPPSNVKSAAGKQHRPWFRRNGVGVGWHPATWQGWSILLLSVAVIVTVVVLLRIGAL